MTLRNVDSHDSDFHCFKSQNLAVFKRGLFGKRVFENWFAIFEIVSLCSRLCLIGIPDMLFIAVNMLIVRSISINHLLGRHSVDRNLINIQLFIVTGRYG
jgi:hypothetical protein